MGCTSRSARLTFVVSATLGLLLTGAAVARARQSAPSSSTSAAPPAPPATATPPWPNRLNARLPPWLQFRADFRERAEGFAASGFTSGRDDLYYLSRFRLTTTIAPSKRVAFQVQLQDARVGSKEVGPTATPFTATFDVRTAYGDFGTATGTAEIRLGRQEMNFGDQRLVGSANWLNAARTFDAGRLTLRRKGLQVDAFAASVVRILPNAWDKSGNGNRFYGVYASSSALVPKATVEPYFFWREDQGLKGESGALGNLHQGTFGVRWVGALPHKFEYGVEAAGQRGSLGTDSIQAWAAHTQVKTPAFGPALRVTAEYNFASGDANPTDGTRGTFDQLYPTAHDKYGLADQVGWRNVHHVRAGVDIARLAGWPITVNYHTWWLAQSMDGLYLASGTLLARIAAGAPERHVGQEVDVQVSHAIAPQLQVAAGYARVIPGAFLKTVTPGASYSAPFAMVTYVFLAEK